MGVDCFGVRGLAFGQRGCWCCRMGWMLSRLTLIWPAAQVAVYVLMHEAVSSKWEWTTADSACTQTLRSSIPSVGYRKGHDGMSSILGVAVVSASHMPV